MKILGQGAYGTVFEASISKDLKIQTSEEILFKAMEIVQNKIKGKEIKFLEIQMELKKIKQNLKQKNKQNMKFNKQIQSKNNTTNPNLAIKQINTETLKEMSSILIESQLHLFFTNDKIALLRLEDMYLNVNEANFTLSLAMVKGDCELLELKKEKQKGLDFINLFPIFKDTILGLAYMNSHYLTHGDIKPANILIKGMTYYLCDYGIGRNLYFESQLINNDLFQVDVWSCTGTPLYCDPVIKKELDKNYKPPKAQYMDLFKNDIFSLAVSIYEIATGKSIEGINQKPYQQICYNEIYKLKLPIQMKNLLIHMIQFESSNRITIFSMQQSLINLIQRVTNSTQLTILKFLNKGQQQFFENYIKYNYQNHDWFNFGFYSPTKIDQYHKIKTLTSQDQTFFSGQQKLDYNKPNFRNEIFKELKKGQIILLKQNYMLCTFDQQISNEEIRVLLNKFTLTVQNNDILTIQHMHYTINQFLEYYESLTNSWINCKIVKKHRNKYDIMISANNKLMKSLPFNTLKLRLCGCLKCIVGKEVKIKFRYQEMIEGEQSLLAFNKSIINTNQLLPITDAHLENPLIKYSYDFMNFKKNAFLKGTYNISCSGQKGFKSQKQEEKLEKLLDKGLIHMLTGLKIKLKNSHLSTFQSGTLKMVLLKYCEISPEQLVRLFNLFCYTKLQRLWLFNQNTIERGDSSIQFNSQHDSEYLKRLKKSFKKFANSQSELYLFWFQIGFQIPKIKKHFWSISKSYIIKPALVMEQFQDISILINKFGYRFKKENFLFQIQMPSKPDVKKFAKIIRSNMDVYYKDWKCELGNLYDSMTRQTSEKGLVIGNINVRNL